MVKNKLIKLIMIMAWVTVFIWVGPGRFLFAFDDKNIKGETAIRIDIPVVLKKVNVVFNMDHLAFDGDMPVGIKYMHLLANRFKELGTEGRIIGIFLPMRLT